MQEYVDESILARIKKFFALAEKNTNEHEAAAAASRATEYLLRYNLTRAEVEAATEEKEEPIVQRKYVGHKDENSVNEARWKVDLAFQVAQGNLCDVIHFGRRTRSYLTWVGKASNIEVAIYLFETLAADLERIADERWQQILDLRKLSDEHGVNLFKNNPELGYVHGKAWKKSFFMGAVSAIGRRLDTTRVELAQADSNIKALIVVNDGALKDYVKKYYPKLGTYDVGGVSAYSGYDVGYREGQNISFKRGISGGGSLAPKRLNSGGD